MGHPPPAGDAWLELASAGELVEACRLGRAAERPARARDLAKLVDRRAEARAVAREGRASNVCGVPTTSASSSSMPAKGSMDAGEWFVRLYNDDVHTVTQVESSLQRWPLGLSRELARRVTANVDGTGSAIVFLGAQRAAMRACRALRSAGLLASLTPLAHLLVEVLTTKSINWLRKQAGAFAPLSRVVAAELGRRRFEPRARLAVVDREDDEARRLAAALAPLALLAAARAIWSSSPSGPTAYAGASRGPRAAPTRWCASRRSRARPTR
jgi:ATP-dependent Clp protease adapter protein ClpS